MDIRASVIVPFFNIAPYLQRCVESILAQTQADFEVVFVNDGSTDDSEAVVRRAMERYARKDVTWKLIGQTNGGLSAARNAGLQAACGKYVLFVDGDDAIHPRLLEKTLAQAEAHVLDYVVFDYETVADESDGWNVAKAVPEFLGGDALEWFVTSAGGPSACRFLFRRETLGDSPFVRGLIYEDNLFVFGYLNRGLRGCHLAAVYYRYYLREGSIVKSSVTLAKIRSVNLIVRQLRLSIRDNKRFKLLCRKVLGRLTRNVIKRARKSPDPFVRSAGADLIEGLLREGLLHYADFGMGWALRLIWLRIAHRLSSPVLEFYLAMTAGRRSRVIIPWQYDCVCSIGHYCATAQNLRRHNLRTFSGPLDWLALEPGGLAQCTDLICDDFRDFLKKETLVSLENKRGPLDDKKCDYYADREMGFEFFHDFPAGIPLNDSFADVRWKYDRRIANFYKKITGQRALLVFHTRLVHPDDAEIWENLQKLRRKLGKGIDLLVLENVHEMQGLEFTEVNPGAYHARGWFHRPELYSLLGDRDLTDRIYGAIRFTGKIHVALRRIGLRVRSSLHLTHEGRRKARKRFFGEEEW